MTYRVYDYQKLTEELSRDEGRKQKPYQDSEGIVTIGIGHNLEAHGLPDHIIDELFDLDVEMAEKALDKIWKHWRMVSPVRQRILVNMAFNLGESRLRLFRKMWAALATMDYQEAARQMLDSKWARQVGVRARRLAKAMQEG